MFRLRDFIATFLLIALLSGCSAFIKEPRIAIKGTSLIGANPSGIDIEFDLGITNPNNFDLSLMGYTYDLSVLTLPLATGRTQMTVHFPAGKETDMRLPVHLNFSDLLEIIKQQPDLNKLPYQLNARLHLICPLGEMVIPVEKNDTLNVPDRYRSDAAIDLLRDVLRSIR